VNNYVLTQEQGDKIITYLTTQPYKDVVGIIEILKTLPVVTIQQEQPKEVTLETEAPPEA
jgi:hypothetical protein